MRQEYPPSQKYLYHSHEKTSTGLSEQDFGLHEGKKLRPKLKKQKRVGRWLALIILPLMILLSAVFVAAIIFHVVFGLLTWIIVVMLIIVGWLIILGISLGIAFAFLRD